jgi:predicted transcriptional regulator
MPEENDPKTVDQVVQLMVAWLGNPNSRIEPEDLPRFVSAMHETLAGLAGSPGGHVPGPARPTFEPAVSVKESLASKDHIISLIDGKPYKMLKRHLQTRGLTPAEYIGRYNLPSDYPMVAENYSKKRRKLAKQIGLGQKGRAARWPDKPAPAKERAAKPGAKPAAKPGTKASAKPAAKPAPSKGRTRKAKSA